MKTDRVDGGNVTGYVMVSMAIYGAMLATTSGGAAVSVGACTTSVISHELAMTIVI